jgi:hypothetical protein
MTQRQSAQGQDYDLNPFEVQIASLVLMYRAEGIHLMIGARPIVAVHAQSLRSVTGALRTTCRGASVSGMPRANKKPDAGFSGRAL